MRYLLYPLLYLLNRIANFLGWLLADNNGRCTFLWAVTLTYGVICVWIGPGVPILSEEVGRSIHEAPQSHYSQGVYDAWERGQETERLMDNEVIPEAPRHANLFWSWFHWRIFGWLLFVAIAYTPIAFREEVRDAWVDVTTRRRDAEAHVTPSAPTPSTGGTTPTTPVRTQDSNRFWRLFQIDLLAEVVWEAARRAMSSIVRAF